MQSSECKGQVKATELDVGVKHQGKAHPITNFHVFEQGATSDNVWKTLEIV